MPSAESRPEPRFRRVALRLATLLALISGLVLLLDGLPAGGTPGWDETGHAFSALRMADALRHGDLSRFLADFHRPDYYAPLGRAVLSLGFLVLGPSWAAPRAVNCVVWILVVALAARLARRLVAPPQADTAAFWTAVFGLTGWLGMSFARGAFLEPMPALIGVASCLVFLRARERGSRALGAVTGLCLGAAVLVKYTYALLFLGAIGLTGLWDVFLRLRGRPGPGDTLRIAPWLAGALALVLAWWFVLPLPKGLAMGAMHRAAFVEYLTKATVLSGPGPEIVPIAWALMSCLSLVAFAVQVAGVGWGFARWNSAAHRLCAVLAFVGPLAMAVYPFRIDRFLLPTLFAAWALGGALCAQWLARLRPRWRPVAGAAGLALLFGTTGVGAEPLLHVLLGGEWGAERSRSVAKAARGWRRPYEHRPVPASGPPGTADVLDVAARHLDPQRPFGWIGGTGTELPRALVQWRLYQESRDPSTLYLAEEKVDHFWEDPIWNEDDFRRWASRFDQVGVLDPPDPRNRPRGFEVHLAAWMDRDPSFWVRAVETVEIEGRLFRVTICMRGDAALAERMAAGDADPGPGVLRTAPLLDNGDLRESPLVSEDAPELVPWWRSHGDAELQVVEDGDRRWLRTIHPVTASQPIAAYAPALPGLRVRGTVRGRGVLTVADGLGGRARVELCAAAGDELSFEVRGDQLALQLGRLLSPRLLLALSPHPEGPGAEWTTLDVQVPLPLPTEEELRAEVIARLDEIFRSWFEHSLDRRGPRETGFVATMFDVVTGEPLNAVDGGVFPLWNLVLDALELHEEPHWRAALDRFFESLFELGFHPDTGLPRDWDCERDVPIDEAWSEIAGDLRFLIDVAERGPERWRSPALVAARRISETVLAKGVLPDGRIAPKYHIATAEPSTSTVPLRQLDLPAELARLGALTGDERYTDAARVALSEFEFLHYWPGSWRRIDPGFDDMFGIYGLRAMAMLDAHPDDASFAGPLESGFQHYAPLWWDAIRFGGTIAADQVRCWRVLADYAEHHPEILPALRRLLHRAVRAHFKSEQYANGSWGDVTFVDFDPKVGIAVGDLPGVPAGLLQGLGLVYQERLGGRNEDVRSMYTAVLRSSVAQYRRTHGYLVTQRELPEVNRCGGGIRIGYGLVEMLRRLSR